MIGEWDWFISVYEIILYKIAIFVIQILAILCLNLMDCENILIDKL